MCFSLTLRVGFSCELLSNSISSLMVLSYSISYFYHC
nr:MAG TPA: hypothetical protein [Caudoviricetes sp.]